MCMNRGTVCKVDRELKNQMGESRIRSALFLEEGKRFGRTGAENKGASLKGRAEGDGWGELVSLSCRLAGAPSVWGSPPTAYCISTGQGRYDPDVRTVPVCAPRHESL